MCIYFSATIHGRFCDHFSFCLLTWTSRMSRERNFWLKASPELLTNGNRLLLTGQTLEVIPFATIICSLLYLHCRDGTKDSSGSYWTLRLAPRASGPPFYHRAAVKNLSIDRCVQHRERDIR